MSKTQPISVLLLIIFILVAYSFVQGCDKTTNTEKGAKIPMETYYIGRFSVAVPAGMKLAVRTAALRYVEINEIVWPKDMSHEQVRTAEWNNFMAEVNKLTPPIRTDKVILRMQEYPGVGQWAKGLFYHKEGDATDEATWSLLVDTGFVALWLKGDSTMVDDENSTNRMANNISHIGENYKVLDMINLKGKPQCNCFYLQHGIINLPYLEEEESYARFKDHPLKLVLTIKMEMDIGYNRETIGLIENTKEMLAVAALQPGGSMSKIRLEKREVAGMKGEESILRISEDGRKTLQFTWEFNGKEDSGEYPTTTIEMESPDGKLDEKIKIWDAVLDSMKPMFVRKK